MEIYASACFPSPLATLIRSGILYECVPSIRMAYRRGAQWRQLASARCNEKGCKGTRRKEKGRNARSSCVSLVEFPETVLLTSFPRW